MHRKDIIAASKGVSLFLVVFSGSLVLISAVEQLMGMPILGVNVLLGIIISTVLLRRLVKMSIRRFLLVTAAGVAILLSATWLSGLFYDIFWDGNAYHKLAVGYLAKGWNATWQTVEQFLETRPFAEAEFLSRNPPWIDFFPKASWYYGASIYKMIPNIEAGKSINLIMIIAAFFAALSGFLKHVPPPCGQLQRCQYMICALAAAMISACSPISLNQVFSFYIDGLLGSIWCLTIISLFCESESEKKYWLIFRFFLIIIGCNLKYTSGAVVGAFCVADYLIKACTNLKKKKYTPILRLTGYYLVCCLAAFGIAGAGAYVKNTICYGHPFYPIIEKGNTQRMDIMAGYLPEEVEQLLPVQKWALITFSKTESARGDTDLHLKLPFHFEKEELLITHIDTERGGMGVFYSGLLLISLGYSLLYYIRRKSLGLHGVLYIACLAACFLLICIIDASWLARYSPYIYFPVMFTGVQMCAQLAKGKQKTALCAAGVIFISLTLINNASFLYCARSTIGETRRIREIRSKHTSLTVSIYLPSYEGPVFNFMDDKLLLERMPEAPDDLNEWYSSQGIYWRYE